MATLQNTLFKMKKLLFFLLFAPITVVANFYPGTIILNDGTVKIGWVQPPPFSSYQEILFKLDLEKTSQSFHINDVNKFEIINANKLKILFTTVILAEFKPFDTTVIIINKKKSWVRVIKDDNLKLYATFDEFMPIIGLEPLYLDVNSTTKFYLKKPNKNFALYFFLTKGSGVRISDFSGLKKLIHLHFKEDCPKILSLYSKPDFKEHGVIYIVDLYNKNCFVD